MEANLGHLYKIAAAISQPENNEANILKSYYLMQCKEITRGFALPEKYFSPKVRCSVCCNEWNKNTDINVKPVTLSKRQRKRLKSRKVKQNPKEFMRKKTELLISNKLEQICAFCKKSWFTNIHKPTKTKSQMQVSKTLEDNLVKQKELIKTNDKPKIVSKLDKAQNKVKAINVYSNALDVFSIKNKNNALQTKEKPKEIKNNKKKKDKFAGLCQKAVLASAKLKEQKKDKLSLFLKPSS